MSTSQTPATGLRRGVLPLPRQAVHDRPVGQVLVQRGLLSEEQLTWALQVQQRTRSRLGEILVSSGLVSRLDLHRALARAWDLPFVDVPGATLDPTLVADLDHAVLAREGWLPLHRTRGGAVFVAVTERPDAALRTRVSSHFGCDVDFAATSSWDLTQGLTALYGRTIVDEAADGLWRRHPDRSARSVLSRRQRLLGGVALVLLVAAALLWPTGTLLVVSGAITLAFLTSVVFTLLLVVVGTRHPAAADGPDDAAPGLPDDRLPVYTVLVPVFGDGGAVTDLVRTVGDLDYPKEKLEVLLLIEEDDRATREAAVAAEPPETITFVTVPSGGPENRSRACNVGLFLARGEFLVVYDADDVPERDQLRRAAAAFRAAETAGEASLVCVQASLRPRDEGGRRAGLLTPHLSAQVDDLLPGLDALGLAVPLRDSSNHFRTDALRGLGGWDPYNLAADTDLGLRALAAGLRVGTIGSTTTEEPDRYYAAWLRRRSRLLTGQMQTALVHLRHPGALVRGAGPARAMGLTILVGGTLVAPLLAPALYGLFLALLVLPVSLLGPLLPAWVLPASVLVLLVGGALLSAVPVAGAFRRRRPSDGSRVLLGPVHGVLHLHAWARALRQLVSRPRPR